MSFCVLGVVSVRRGLDGKEDGKSKREGDEYLLLVLMFRGGWGEIRVSHVLYLNCLLHCVPHVS